MIVPVVPGAGMSAGLVMLQHAKLEPGEIERRSDSQQQDQAKAKPLPRPTPAMPPNPVHAGSLGEPRNLRHPQIAHP